MYNVEVFPIEAHRWIALIEGPAGPFSTEAPSPEKIADEVRSAITEVLGDNSPQLRLVDERGQSWTSEIAAAQVAALDGR
jgi:hypothetical protein